MAFTIRFIGCAYSAHATIYAVFKKVIYLEIYIATLAISPQGQITLPPEILQHALGQCIELEVFCMGNAVILRPAHTQKSDDISDLGGFFKNNAIVLSDEELCKPVDFSEE